MDSKTENQLKLMEQVAKYAEDNNVSKIIFKKLKNGNISLQVTYDEKKT